MSISSKGNKTPESFKVTAQDKINYFSCKVSSVELHCVLKFEGRLNEDLIQKAVRLSLDCEPILGCRFVEQVTKPFWQRREDLDEIKFCTVIESDNADENKEIEEFAVKAIDSYEDPLVNTIIFRGEDSDILCIKLSHVVCDAGGLKEYTYLLASIYGKLCSDSEYIPNVNTIEVRDQSQILKKFGIIQKMKEIRKFQKSNPLPTWCFPCDTVEMGNQALSIRHIDKESFNDIKNFGKSHGATISDMILTAYYRALFEIIKPEVGMPMYIQVPVNLRRYMDEKKAEAICSLQGDIYPGISRIEDESFENTLRRVSRIMIGLKKDNPGIGSAFAIEILSKGNFSKSKKLAHQGMENGIKHRLSHPYLLNTGIISAEETVFGDLRPIHGYIISPIMYPPGFMLGVSTFNDVITLTVGYCEPAVKKEAVEQLLENIILQLTSL